MGKSDAVAITCSHTRLKTKQKRVCFMCIGVQATRTRSMKGWTRNSLTCGWFPGESLMASHREYLGGNSSETWEGFLPSKKGFFLQKGIKTLAYCWLNKIVYSHKVAGDDLEKSGERKKIAEYIRKNKVSLTNKRSNSKVLCWGNT